MLSTFHPKTILTSERSGGYIFRGERRHNNPPTKLVPFLDAIDIMIMEIICNFPSIHYFPTKVGLVFYRQVFFCDKSDWILL